MNFNSGRILGIKINGVPKDFNSLSFGRQIEYRHIIADFQKTAQRGSVDQKRRKHSAALKEFIRLNEVTEYYFITHDSPTYRDDGFEIWYKTKAA